MSNERSANRAKERLRRCFFAIALSSELIETVANTIAYLRELDHETVRWTDPKNVHLTLRFLGELDAHSFSRAAHLLGTLRLDGPISLRLDRVNGFPSLRTPRVLVVDVTGNRREDHQALTSVQKSTEKIAEELGLEAERRPFRPHVTLGRVRPNRRLSRSLRETLPSVPLQNSGQLVGEAEDVLFVESRLTPAGPRYQIRERVRL